MAEWWSNSNVDGCDCNTVKDEINDSSLRNVGNIFFINGVLWRSDASENYIKS